MAVRVLALIALYALAANGQQCDSEIASFHDCLRESHKNGGPPGGDELRAKFDKCFTDNGCEAPKPPGGGQGPPPDGPPPDGPDGIGPPPDGPDGMGPPPGGPDGQGQGATGSGGNDSRRKCFDAIRDKIKDQVTACVRKTDPSFNPPSKPPPDFGPPGGGPPGGGPPGGPGGPPGGFGRGPPIPFFFLQSGCSKASSGAADKVRACLLAEAQKHGPPTEDEMRKGFNKHCDAKKACDAKLSQPCKDKMNKLGPAICQCHQDLKPQFQKLFQQESACSGLQLPERLPGPFGNTRDCKAPKPEDPCQQGFDAFFKQRQQNGPAPGQGTQ